MQTQKLKLLLRCVHSFIGKESAYNVGDLGSIPGLGRSPGEGKGYPLQYSGLEKKKKKKMGVGGRYLIDWSLSWIPAIIRENIELSTYRNSHKSESIIVTQCALKYWS